MKRQPTGELEAALIRHLARYLPARLGEPEADDGLDLEFRTPDGRVAVTYAGESVKVGVANRRRDGKGAAGLDLLPLLGLDADDFKAWLDDGDDPADASDPVDDPVEPKSAPAFRLLLAHAQPADRDPRVAAYLAGRGLTGIDPPGLAVEGGSTKHWRRLLVQATDLSGDVLALQALPLDPAGAAGIDDAGRKLRRTFAGQADWSHRAAFRLPGDGDETLVVEGLEDALACRLAGWQGPIAAALGKGNAGKVDVATPGVVLALDGDVEAGDVDKAVRAQCRAGRAVRVAILPDGDDPAAMVASDRAGDLLACLDGADDRRDRLAVIEAELARFPATAEGRDAYAAERRSLAKRLDVAAGDLDRMRARLVGDDDHGEADDGDADRVTVDCQPWPEPVDGRALVHDLAGLLAEVVIFPDDDRAKASKRPPDGALASALWVVMSHAFPAFDGPVDPCPFSNAPRLSINAATFNAGKTTLLEAVLAAAARGLDLVGLTGPGLFRMIEAERPTVGLDEVDQSSLHADDKLLLSLLNVGHGRGGKVTRLVGEDYRVKAFRVFGPIVFAGKGSLPTPLMQRSIGVWLEKVSRKRRRLERTTRAELAAFGRKARRWIDDHVEALGIDRDDQLFPRPDGASDRTRDNWRPLLDIADRAGMLGEAQALYRRMTAGVEAADFETRLLLAIVDLIDDPASGVVRKSAGGDRYLIPGDVAKALNRDDDAEWSELNRGGGLSANRVGRLLGDFHVARTTFRPASGKPRYGYPVDQVEAKAAPYRAQADAPPKKSDYATTWTEKTPKNRHKRRQKRRGKSDYVADGVVASESVENAQDTAGNRDKNGQCSRVVAFSGGVGRARRQRPDLGTSTRPVDDPVEAPATTDGGTPGLGSDDGPAPWEGDDADPVANGSASGPSAADVEAALFALGTKLRSGAYRSLASFASPVERDWIERGEALGLDVEAIMRRVP